MTTADRAQDGAAPTRSWLYVPGDRPDRIAKALASGADVVIIDLEDAVKPAAKPEARLNAVAVLAGAGGLGAQRWVRINSGDEGRHDLAALAAGAGAGAGGAGAGAAGGGALPDGVLLAKCERLDWIAAVAAALPGVPIAALVETAVALRDIEKIAGAPGVVCCHLGEVDLLADVGGRLPGGQVLLDHARVAVVVASAAACIAAPIGGVHLQIDDLAALHTTSLALAEMGFGGRALIHPSHCAGTNEAFSPTAAEVAWAHDVLARLGAGHGAVRGAEGEMIDEAVARRARRVLAAAAEPEPRPPA
ncbi:MAG: aldolase/citrate lyase family protein [Actinomycetota bacterium]|nr:aldolase/citrate lyase family protein [Actinomycetota bacterium]